MIRRLVALGIALLTASVVAGCGGGQNPYHPKVSDTRLAAFAAQTRFPYDMQARDDIPIMAIVNRFDGKITLHSFADRVIRAPRLWVNRTYVLPMNDIPARDAVITVDPSDLYNSAGVSLKDQKPDAIQNLQLETEDNLINVKGPHFQ